MASAFSRSFGTLGGRGVPSGIVCGGVAATAAAGAASAGPRTVAMRQIRAASTATVAARAQPQPRVCEPGKTRVAFIGCGVMGRQMCGHLMKAGFSDMNVYTRTAHKADALAAAGARVVGSPREAARDRDVVISIVGYPRDVESVLGGPDGALGALTPGSIMIDMTTSTPALAMELAVRARERGVFSLDAPVSGGDVGARNAALSIMVGGDKEAAEAVQPLFTAMGKNIRFMGGPGLGQRTKAFNQILIAGSMISMCEALLYAEKAGLDLQEAIDAVSQGAAGSWSIINYGPRIIKRDFAPGFFVEHFIKDMEIALDEARQMHISLPGLALVHQLYMALKAQGHERLGTQSLQLALEHINGINRK